MDARIRSWAAKRGYRAAWFDAEVIPRAFARIRRFRRAGDFDPGFYERFLSWLDEAEAAIPPEAKTVLLVAVPVPAHVLVFENGTGRRELILPPTYLRYRKKFPEVLEDLVGHVGEAPGLRRLEAPLKTIAGLTGFARYGRNNITYVEGFGSFVQLVGLTADVPLAGAFPVPGAAPEALPACARCRACLRACPARAIVEDRFLFRGESCLTGFSEEEGPLPETFSRLRTQTLVGCLACQEICPANRGRLRFERLAATISADETAYILGERGDGPPPPALVEKMKPLGLSDIRISESGPTQVFRRNLRAVLERGA